MSAINEAMHNTFDTKFDRVIKKALKLSSVPPGDLDLSSAGISSFDAFNLMMALEDEFDIIWPAEDLVAPLAMTTVDVLRSRTREILHQGGQ